MAELFDGHIASEMTLGEAIVRGILSAPKYVTTVYQYQKDLAKYQTRVDNLHTSGIQDVNRNIWTYSAGHWNRKTVWIRFLRIILRTSRANILCSAPTRNICFAGKVCPWQMGQTAAVCPPEIRKEQADLSPERIALLNAIGMQWRNLTRGSTGMNWRRNIKDAMEIWTFQQNTRQRMASG